MARIETLDADGWARITAHRAGVLARCLAEPFDRDRIVAAARHCYLAIGRPEPLILWAPGPIAALAWSAVIRYTDPNAGQLGGQLGDQLWDQLGGQLRGQLRGQLWGQLWDQLRGQLGGQLGDQLGGQLGDQLWDQLGGQLRGQLGDQLRGQLWDQLRGQLRGQLGDQLRGQLWDQLRGQLWGQLGGQLWGQLRGQLGGQLGDQLGGAVTTGWWIAGAEFYATIAHLDGITPPPADLLATNRAFADLCTVPMFIPLTGVCILVEQHARLARDTQGRLHSTDGPAWSWADGTEVWALDGIRVPSWVIDDPTPTRILTELPNTEQRRVALAHYGWDRAVNDLALEVIDTADDPTWGTLYRLPDEIGAGQASLLVARNASPDRDGTVRTYGLLAAAECRTVVAAQASLAQLSEAEWLALDGAS